MATDLQGEREFGKAYDARLIRRLWTFVRPYRQVFWLALLLSAAQQAFRLVQPYLVKVGIDRYVARYDGGGLRALGLVYLAMIAAEFAAYYGQQYLTMVLAQRSLADLRVALFARVQRFPMRFFDQNPVGRVVSRLTTDVDVLQEMFAAGAMTIVLDVLGLAGIVAVMLWIDWRLALTSLALFPVIVAAVDFFRRQVRRTYRMIRERIARINGYLQEAISGMTAYLALKSRIGTKNCWMYWMNATSVPISRRPFRVSRPPSHSSIAIETVLIDSTKEKSAASSLLERWYASR